MLLLAFALSSCTCAPRQPTVTRTALTRLPDDIKPGSLVIGENHTDVLYARHTPDGVHIVHGGVQGPPYSDIGQLRLAPGSDGVFYWAINVTGEERHLFLIANNTALAVEPPINRPLDFVFTPTGKRWATVAGTEPSADGQTPTSVRMWIDGQVAGPYPDMTKPAFSPDGAHAAALVDTGSGRVALIVDGKSVRVFDTPVGPAVPRLQMHAVGPNMPEQFAISYLVNGELLLLTTDRDGWAVYRGEMRLGSYRRNQPRSDSGPRMDFGGVLATAPSIASHTLTSASAAPVAAWWARDAGDAPRWRVMRDGIGELTTCTVPSNDPPALSTDGRHLAYACQESAEGQPLKVAVIHDGRRDGPYDAVWMVAISANGRHVAFAADSGTPERPWFYVIDGRRGRLRFDQAFPPRFSPDGRHVAWVAKRQRGEKRGDKFLLFLDGNSYASSDEVVTGPSFSDGALSWVSMRGKRLARLTITH
ncbi:MAG: hypothetical protein ABI629_23685 [bacterium]